MTFREHWERLRFRDYLIAHRDAARAYAELKTRLSAAYPNNRIAYTSGKSDFIAKVMAQIPSAPRPLICPLSVPSL